MKTITSRSRIPTQTRKASRARNGNGSGNTETRIRPGIAAWLKKPKQNLIDGEWSPAASGKLFDVFNPADASVIARVSDSDKNDINRAVTAARRAFESGPWRRLTSSERAVVRIEATSDTGCQKPRRTSRAARGLARRRCPAAGNGLSTA